VREKKNGERRGVKEWKREWVSVTITGELQNSVTVKLEATAKVVHDRNGKKKKREERNRERK
jgi:hypothetical protein